MQEKGLGLLWENLGPRTIQGYSKSFSMGIADIMVLYRKKLKALPWLSPSLPQRKGDQSTLGTSSPRPSLFPALLQPVCSQKGSIKKAFADLSVAGTATFFAFPASAPGAVRCVSVCVCLSPTSGEKDVSPVTQTKRDFLL